MSMFDAAPASGERLSPRRIRVLGGMLCVIGALLGVFMTVAAWQNAPTFLNPGELIDGDRFTGTAAQGTAALALFISVAVTGFVLVGAGVHQLRTGRRDKRLLGLVIAAFAITALLAWQAKSALQ
ncbi:MAG: hypothetical protein H7Z19_24160 [Chitinophagaceae bacterium]|nr:hypothetical protein [Rubrivivax sp.]